VESLADRKIVSTRVVDAPREKVRGFAPEASEQNFDRLEAELARMA
jgi:hypothetical protein